jgi:Tfp pilus assembly protein PilN
MGGLLGLFLGCSLITLIEVIYSIVKLTIERQNRHLKVEEIEKSNDELSIIKFGHVIYTMKSIQRDQAQRMKNLEEIINKRRKDDDILRSLNDIIHKNQRY